MRWRGLTHEPVKNLGLPAGISSPGLPHKDAGAGDLFAPQWMERCGLRLEITCRQFEPPFGPNETRDYFGQQPGADRMENRVSVGPECRGRERKCNARLCEPVSVEAGLIVKEARDHSGAVLGWGRHRGGHGVRTNREEIHDAYI